VGAKRSRGITCGRSCLIVPTSRPSRGASNHPLTTSFLSLSQTRPSKKLFVDQANNTHDVSSHGPTSDAMALQGLKEFFLLRLKLFSTSFVNKTQEAHPQVLVHRVSGGQRQAEREGAHRGPQRLGRCEQRRDLLDGHGGELCSARSAEKAAHGMGCRVGRHGRSPLRMQKGNTTPPGWRNDVPHSGLRRHRTVRLDGEETRAEARVFRTLQEDREVFRGSTARQTQSAAQPQGCEQRRKGRHPVSCRDIRRSRDMATEVVDSSAGHDCERQSTGVGWISNNKPKTTCNESCVSTNTDRSSSSLPLLYGNRKGAEQRVPCA
jgi:hypothetical protein